MAKAQTQISLASGQIFCFMACPNLASDSVNASVVFAIGAATNASFATDGLWANATVGDLVGPFGTISRLTTNTPYPNATLATGYEYACTGSGIKFTYEGSELYRGGTLRYVYDKESSYNEPYTDWASKTVNNLITFIDTSPNSIRQSLNKDNVVEINTSATRTEYYASNTGYQTCFSAGSNDSALLGGTTKSTRFSLRPNLLGYYVNTSGNTISFHVDVVEHWSVSSPVIQSLQTPSYAHAAMATHVTAVMDNVRQMHAGKPNVHHASVANETVKAMKSPMGHELLNVGLRAALA